MNVLLAADSVIVQLWVLCVKQHVKTLLEVTDVNAMLAFDLSITESAQVIVILLYLLSEVL